MILRANKNSWCSFLLLAVSSQVGCQLFFNLNEDDFLEASQERCNDGVDNDENGTTDCAELTCQDFCPPAVCGDNTLSFGEACDDGNLLDTDACLSTCQNAECGDGFVQDTVEECDDAGVTAGDGCDATCATEPGFACVGAPSVCHPIVCGDTLVDLGEECDDGNTLSGDNCDSLCLNEAVCGDSVIDLGEGCDDGNVADSDGCSAACLLEAPCGDGDVDFILNEECDDGNTANNDGCSSACILEDAATAFVLCDGINGTGTRADPFSTIANALTTASPQIAVLDGPNCAESVTITRDARIFGLDGNLQGLLSIDGGAAPALILAAPNLNVEVNKIALNSNQSGATISIQGGASGSHIGFFGVAISNLSADPASLAIQCNPTAAAQVMLDEAFFFDSTGGGVRLGGACQMLAANTSWFGAGSATSPQGAFSIDTPSTARLSVLYSTFFGGQALAGINTVINGGDAGQCAVDSVIVHNSNADALGANLYFDPECAVSFSDTMLVTTPGVGNINADPQFDPNGFPFFFELLSTSLARNVANPSPQTVPLPFDPKAVFGIDPFTHDSFARSRFTPSHMGANQTP